MPDMDELRQIMTEGYEANDPDDDIYDELIAEIVKIEKAHKYNSRGESDRLDQINRQIEKVIKQRE